MTTDKTSLGDWAREKADEIAEAVGFRSLPGGYAIAGKVEAAIIEGMVAALDAIGNIQHDSFCRQMNGLLPPRDLSKCRCAVGQHDALKKELRGNNAGA